MCCAVLLYVTPPASTMSLPIQFLAAPPTDEGETFIQIGFYLLATPCICRSMIYIVDQITAFLLNDCTSC